MSGTFSLETFRPKGSFDQEIQQSWPPFAVAVGSLFDGPDKLLESIGIWISGSKQKSLFGLVN
jgi:hypothetical protein